MVQLFFTFEIRVGFDGTDLSLMRAPQKRKTSMGYPLWSYF